MGMYVSLTQYFNYIISQVVLEIIPVVFCLAQRNLCVWGGFMGCILSVVLCEITSMMWDASLILYCWYSTFTLLNSFPFHIWGVFIFFCYHVFYFTFAPTLQTFLAFLERKSTAFPKVLRRLSAQVFKRNWVSNFKEFRKLGRFGYCEFANVLLFWFLPIRVLKQIWFSWVYYFIAIGITCISCVTCFAQVSIIFSTSNCALHRWVQFTSVFFNFSILFNQLLNSPCLIDDNLLEKISWKLLIHHSQNLLLVF